ncbi:hypothetical protein EVAR_951_1 [Eumeta japonica]|uniref:Uncharacterized protein n=1 Tax=Eumeta variegata TaxID=151549 RepID=A0A4C1SE60_EUMVA|nr:hypothetical protein EVAR_951_1 [Eumeta japonica]
MAHFPLSPLHHPDLPAIRYPIPSQVVNNGLVTPPELRVSMGGGDRLLSDGSSTRLSVEYLRQEANGSFHFPDCSGFSFSTRGRNDRRMAEATGRGGEWTGPASIFLSLTMMQLLKEN